MLPETRQVLLLHKNRGTHVVAEAGQEIDGFIVDDITDDEVTLVAPNGAEVILAAPDLSWRRRAAERKAAAAKQTAVAGADGVVTDGAATGPVDPYAEPSSSSVPAPADPYAEYDAGIAAFAEAVGAQPVPAVTEAAAPAAAAPVTKPVTKPAAKATPAAGDVGGTLAAAVTGSRSPAANPASAPAGGTAITVARADVDAALADFGATAVTFDARFVADGLRIDSIVDATILAKAGLASGDTITAIDGKPLRSFDDAADLYARMQTARAATISVQRAGKPVTLKVTIR